VNHSEELRTHAIHSSSTRNSATWNSSEYMIITKSAQNLRRTRANHQNQLGMAPEYMRITQNQHRSNSEKACETLRNNSEEPSTHATHSGRAQNTLQSTRNQLRIARNTCKPLRRTLPTRQPLRITSDPPFRVHSEELGLPQLHTSHSASTCAANANELRIRPTSLSTPNNRSEEHLRTLRIHVKHLESTQKQLRIQCCQE
jgi:hypothetical protein